MKMMQMKKILFSRGRIENQRGLLDKRNLVGRIYPFARTTIKNGIKNLVQELPDFLRMDDLEEDITMLRISN